MGKPAGDTCPGRGNRHLPASGIIGVFESGDSAVSMPQRALVRKFILGNFLFTEDDAALKDADSLIRSGVVDSTGVLELITHLEESLGIRVPPEEMVPQNFDSVDAICAYLARKVPA